MSKFPCGTDNLVMLFLLLGTVMGVVTQTVSQMVLDLEGRV